MIGIMVAVVMVRARQRWTDQLPVSEVFVVDRRLSRESNLKISFIVALPPARAFVQTTPIRGP